MPSLPSSLKEYSKLVVAVLGVLGMLLSQGFLTGDAATIVSAILAVATSLGVYQARNQVYPTPSPVLGVVTPAVSDDELAVAAPPVEDIPTSPPTV